MKSETFWNWASDYKTVILLGGGNYCSMKELAQFFDSEDNPYPHGIFHEEKDAMDGLLTNVMIVLPPRIYDVASHVRRRNLMFNKDGTLSLGHADYIDNSDVTECNIMIMSYGIYSEFEIELINRLNRYQLAS
jgi:hypothetical protein